MKLSVQLRQSYANPPINTLTHTHEHIVKQKKKKIGGFFFFSQCLSETNSDKATKAFAQNTNTQRKQPPFGK